MKTLSAKQLEKHLNGLINDCKEDWECLKYAKQRKKVMKQAMNYCLGCCFTLQEIELWWDGYLMGLEVQYK
jgi:hypothetical protein